MAGGKVWSKAEDKIVRDMWSSERLIKECIDLLPGRSERAILTRVWALKLGPRPEMNRRAKSVIMKMVLAEMDRGYVFSSRDIMNKYGCTLKHASDLLADSKRAKKIHVQDWRRSRPGGCYMAVYGIGDLPDAERPSSKTMQEYNRTRYVNKRMKEGKIGGNVFAVAMAQVMGQETPKQSKGRYRSRLYVQEAA
jgi:hypothetical protein